MKANKLLISFLSLVVILSLMSIGIFASENSATVSTQKELAEALSKDNITSITIASNIIFSGDWTPAVIKAGRNIEIIGGENGVTLSNMAVHDALKDAEPNSPRSGSSCYYFCGFIGENYGDVTIKNVTFKDAIVDAKKADMGKDIKLETCGSSSLAVVIGYNNGSLTCENVNIENCEVTGYTKIGGFTGHGRGNLAITKCSVVDSSFNFEKFEFMSGDELIIGEPAYGSAISGYQYTKPVINSAKVSGNKFTSDFEWKYEEKDGEKIYYIHDEVYDEWVPAYSEFCQVLGYPNTTVTIDGITLDKYMYNFVTLAKIDGYEYPTLDDALNDSVSGDTIILLNDIELSEMINFDTDKSVILDLNGKVLTTAEDVKAVAEISNGSITLVDSASTKGKVNATNMAFRVVAGASTSGTLIIEKDVVVFSKNECAIFIKGQDATLITEGNISTTGVHAAISGNGNPENGGIKVFVNGGKVTSDKTSAIYFPNTTLLQIKDGIFTGSVAVYQKSGKLDITGGTFIGTGEKADYVYNPSGLNSTGDALVVESCNYPGGVPTVSITGGYFSSKNNQAIASYTDKGGKDTLPEKIVGFISGGHFTSDPTEFLVAGKVAVASTEEGYLFTVEDKNSEIEVKTSLEVTEPVIENKTEAQISGDFEVDVETLKSEASVLLNDSSVIDSEEAIAAVENLEGYVSGETLVTVVVQPYMEVEITDFVSGESLTVDITPKYNLVATISGDEELILSGDNKNAVVLEEGKTLNVKQAIEVTIPLPQGFADGLTQVFVHHKGHIYTADVINTQNGDVAVFTNPHGFSEFSVKRTLEAVAQNTTTNEMYDTLEAAIKEAVNNDTIALLKANNENVVVDRVITFVFDANGFEYSGDITAGSTVVLEKTENDTNDTVTYAFTKKQTSPVVGGGGSTSSIFTIKFETNGGSKIENVKVEKNAKIEKPADPTKDGYTFDGWYTDKEFKNAYDFNKEVKKGFTLYAKWAEVVADEEPFTDVDRDDWFYGAVKYAFVNKLVNGVSNTEFAPNSEITRAMLVTILYRLEGEVEVSGDSKFEDVVSGSYYEKAVIWAEANGIVNGISDTEFAPDNKITREQIVAIMFRFANYKGIDTSVGENTNILSYDDVGKVSEYAIPAMQWAVGSGLMKGKTASTLNPTDTATRAEVVTILQRFIETNK